MQVVRVQPLAMTPMVFVVQTKMKELLGEFYIKVRRCIANYCYFFLFSYFKLFLMYRSLISCFFFYFRIDISSCKLSSLDLSKVFSSTSHPQLRNVTFV